ncbi:hypothetical protein YC2023_095002 [Brassica napus]
MMRKKNWEFHIHVVNKKICGLLFCQKTKKTVTHGPLKVNSTCQCFRIDYKDLISMIKIQKIDEFFNIAEVVSDTKAKFSRFYN